MQKNTKQLKLFNGLSEKPYFGGELLKGRRRSRRPINTALALHIVIRASLAKGKLSFLNFHDPISNALNEMSHRHQVRLYKWANSGNHIHLLIRATHRNNYRKFIRGVTSIIWQIVVKSTGAMPKKGGFWDHRPFSRIVSWGRDYIGVTNYILKNTLEALKIIAYTPRAKKQNNKIIRV